MQVTLLGSLFLAVIIDQLPGRSWQDKMAGMTAFNLAQIKPWKNLRGTVSFFPTPKFQRTMRSVERQPLNGAERSSQG